MIPVDWTMRVERPVVVIAQIRTRYAALDATEGLIRPIDDAAYQQQLDSVIKFARMQQAQFCIFPEYCWPVSFIETLFDSLHATRQEDMVYVLPFEHMETGAYREYLKWLKESGWVGRDIYRHEIEELDRTPNADAGYVNASFTALQTRKRLIVIPQRKLHPAALEQSLDRKLRFVPGRTVRVIEAKVQTGSDSSSASCRFATLICFDILHRNEASPDRPRDVLAKMNINYLFVPECNPQPLHDLYLKAEIAMFQAPRWAQYDPVVLFVNVAAHSDLALPEGETAHWGYSRLVGSLGAIGGSGGFLAYKGYIGKNSPQSLENVAENGVRVGDKKMRTAVVRPEQAVIKTQLPSVTSGPTNDPTTGRIDTAVDIYRPVGFDPKQWLKVLAPRAPAKMEKEGIPNHLRGNTLSGFDHLTSLLVERMQRKVKPILIAGQPGAGKSALVAAVLEKEAPHDEKIWIDLGEVAPGEEPLVEALLVKLGRRDALGAHLDAKLIALGRELRHQSTVIVLDGPEEWDDVPLPDSVLSLHGWKTLVITVTKRLPTSEDAPAPDVILDALPDKEFAELVAHHAHKPPGEAFLSALMKATQRSPLAAVWGGELLATGVEAAKSLTEELELSDAPGLETIFRWCYDTIDETAQKLLGVLCEIPGSLPRRDLAAIIEVEPTEVVTPVQTLETLRLIQRTGTEASEPLYRAHPFVRHIWRRAPDDARTMSWNETVEWARWASGRYGSDHNFSDLPMLNARWPSIFATLRRLARGDDRYWQRHFLHIWRKCDEFLWIYGFWRERIELARIACRFAENVDESEDEKTRKEMTRLRAHALYDSIAKTEWHLTREVMPANEHVEQALKLARAIGDRKLQARVLWYRSRLLLHCGKRVDAANVANDAVLMAKSTRKAYTIALALNGRGNVYRERGGPERYVKARQDYEAASRQLRNASTSKDQWAEELKAVLQRNTARLDLLEGHPELALARFEEAMAGFRRLHSAIQEAECAVYHAEALAAVGDVADAEREIDWAESIVRHLGSTLLQQIIDGARVRVRTTKPPS